MDTLSGYIIVTPLKNECNNIPNLVESILNQTIKPTLWVIVNDNSTDCSKELLSKYSKKYGFIKVIDFPTKYDEYDTGLHYSEVCKYGFDYAIDYANKNNIPYEYIGLLDADITLEKGYFEKLIKEFQKNQNLGILCGVIYSWNGKEYIMESYRRDLPRGAARLWRKECFFDTGGYIISYSPDTVSNIKALLKGWKIATAESAKAYQSRLTSGKNIYIGWRKNGESAYYLYKSPVIVLLKSLYLIFKGRFKEGFGYWIGYFSSFINKKERIKDEDIKRFNKRESLQKIIHQRIKGGNTNEKI